VHTSLSDEDLLSNDTNLSHMYSFNGLYLLATDGCIRLLHRLTQAKQQLLISQNNEVVRACVTWRCDRVDRRPRRNDQGQCRDWFPAMSAECHQSVVRRWVQANPPTHPATVTVYIIACRNAQYKLNTISVLLPQVTNCEDCLRNDLDLFV